LTTFRHNLLGEAAQSREWLVFVYHFTPLWSPSSLTYSSLLCSLRRRV